MYFPYFIAYITVGFIISLTLFLWALKHNQFRDQQRARFLPLENDTVIEAAPVTGISRYEIYGLLLLACAGLLASAAVLVFALLSGGSA